MGRLLALTVAYLAYLLATAIGSQRQQHRVQHGPCSYTFILPEVEHCLPLKDFQVTNTLQRDSPPEAEPDTSQSKQSKAQKERPSWQERKLESLENAMENNTQWLQKLENFIQENVRSGMEEIKRTAVHTQTAAMLEMGTNLLSQSAEQTRKLTDVETQVLNQTSRLEIQLLEYSLFTNRLEKHILLQTQEISSLSDKNSFLEQRLLALESRYGRELQGLQSEKQQLQELLERQSRLVSQLQGELGSSTLNSTLLQRQQAVLTDTVQQLLAMVNHCNEISSMPKVEPLTFRDCAEILRSGAKESGIYNISLHNSTQTVKVFCDMKTRGGGWTVLQHRRNGSVDFHRGWRDYKMGFGEPSGEHWLGNDIIHKLTSSQEYSLHVQLKDREGNEAFSHYDRFFIDGEDNNYNVLILKRRTQGTTRTIFKNVIQNDELSGGLVCFHISFPHHRGGGHIHWSITGALGNTQYLPLPAFMPRASVAQLDEPAASPTLAASSAPRTETTTAAPVNVHSSHQEVSCFHQLQLLNYPHPGWWFEACGPSNLNGIYYPASSSVVRYNGIKWYYWKGPNLMATMTTMMVRPANF